MLQFVKHFYKKAQFFCETFYAKIGRKNLGERSLKKIWVKERNVTLRAAKTPLNSSISAVSVPRETECRLLDFPRETYKNGYFANFIHLATRFEKFVFLTTQKQRLACCLCETSSALPVRGTYPVGTHSYCHYALIPSFMLLPIGNVYCQNST